MSSAKITHRQISIEEADRLGQVWQFVYRRGQAIEKTADLINPGTKLFIAEQDGEPVGGYQVEDFLMTRGAGQLRVGGVAAVGVLPESRTDGVGQILMTESLNAMRREGFAMAALYAFRDSYYRRFGYEIAGHRLQITCPQSRFPRIECRMPVRRLAAADVMELEDCFRTFARNHSGVCLRTEHQWSDRLGSNSPTIYVIGDPIQAYCWTGLEGNFWEELKFGEVAWSTHAGYESLLGFMGGLAINRSQLTWNEPSNSPFLASYRDQGVIATMDRPVMWRVLDVPAAFAGLRPEASGNFAFELEDPQMPTNLGIWTVDFSPAGCTATRGGTPAFRLDIRALSQAMMGEPSLESLARLGRVEILNPSEFQSAKTLLTPMSVICSEFF